MAIAVNAQMSQNTKPSYSAKYLSRARPQKFTLRGQKQNPKHISDLEWQVKFTKMKLNRWRDLNNDRWTHLEDLHKQAKQQLKAQKKLYFG